MSNVNPMPGGCGFADTIYQKVLSYCDYPNAVLELGCGVGGNLAKFKNSKTRVGIDPYKPNIDAAQHNCKAILGDHTHLKEFKANQFDLGITCSVLDHIEDFKVAFCDMIRICRELVLLEPMKNGVNRQCKKFETSHWKSTWYHDYVGFLNSIDVVFSTEPSPLYKTNSGPLYHFIYVRGNK